MRMASSLQLQSLLSIAFLLLLSQAAAVSSLNTKSLSISREFFSTADGVIIDVQKTAQRETLPQNNGPGKNKKQPLLFIHGSCHSSWCFDEIYVPHMASLGHTCYAVNLRGTKRSPVSSREKKSVKIEEHVADLFIVIESINAAHDSRPVVLSHSFGGLISMKMMENDRIRSGISGVALMCSVPPSGNADMTKRFIRDRFFSCFKIIYGFVFKGVTKSADLARELFFDNESISNDELRLIVKRFDEDSIVGVDLVALKDSLPSLQWDNMRQAKWLQYSPPSLPRRLVIGATQDYIVDKSGVVETATYLGVEPVFVDCYHDVMLGAKAGMTLQLLEDWISECVN